jgi:hypothetical protein
MKPQVSMTPLDELQWHFQISRILYKKMFKLDPAVALRHGNPIPRPHWDRGI